jgi:hypothetical protein
MNLLQVEMRRALHRRVVWVLIGVALLGCAAAGIISFIDSRGKSLSELQYGDEIHPAVLAHWWISSKHDGIVLIPAFFLLLGGMFGGAAVAGAEWRSNTITTVLTWEPRRVRLHLLRTSACAILAFVIAVGLQMLFLAALLPAVFGNGTSAGVDAQWWLALATAIGRTALLTSLAASLAVALATLGRNTAFALGVVFAWFAVIENLIRGLRPRWTPYLWGENLGAAVTWRSNDGEFSRTPLLALVTIGAYTALLIAAATVAFQRRDIAGVS